MYVITRGFSPTGGPFLLPAMQAALAAYSQAALAACYAGLASELLLPATQAA